MQVFEVKFDALAFHEYVNNGYILPVALEWEKCLQDQESLIPHSLKSCEKIVFNVLIQKFTHFYRLFCRTIFQFVNVRNY